MKTTTKPRRVFRLSEEEARTLQQIFQNVGGCPRNSPRRVVDALYTRLVKTFGWQGRYSSMGSIHFNEYGSR